MNKLDELKTRLDRVEQLMKYMDMSIEEMLACCVNSQSTNCDKCPILKNCLYNEDMTCYEHWLNYLENK